jgi:pimeloyl-ACP methyl ester carboxylesterase
MLAAMPFVTAPDGLRIAYDVAGESGPALVLLAGSLGDRRQWARAGYVDAFRTIARVVSIDALGRGESDAPHDQARYGIERHAGDVLAVLDALGIARATMWGHSMGGRIGFELAARHPERVEALIATGSSGHGFSPYARALNESADALYASGMRAAAEAIAATVEMPGWMVDNWAADDAGAIAASVRANAGWDGADDAMATLEAPVLLLVGERDAVLPEARRTAETVPRCVLVELEDCDHVSSFTRSDVACALALEFLRGLWTPGDELSPGGDNPVDK